MSWLRLKRRKPLPMAIDLHMHSTFSPDGRSSMQKMCAAAVRLGLTEIAFTEHAEWNGHIEPFRPNQGYYAAVAACRKRFASKGLRVLSGVELGNPHWFSAESKAFLDAHPFDVRIGSVHWLYDNYNIHGPQPFAVNDPLTVFTDYFLQAEEMINRADFDILAHSDRIWWRASAMGLACSASDLVEPLQRVMSACVARSVYLELNTKYIAGASNWNADLAVMLNLYRKAGGTYVSVNSDAHHHTQIGRNFAVAADLLKAADLLPLTSVDLFQH